MIQVKVITAGGDDYELLDAGAPYAIKGTESDGKGPWHFGNAFSGPGGVLTVVVWREIL